MNPHIVLRDPEESQCDSNLYDEMKILCNFFWDDNLSYANPLQCLSMICEMNGHFWTERCFKNFTDNSICHYLSRAKFFPKGINKNYVIISTHESHLFRISCQNSNYVRIFFFFFGFATAFGILVPQPGIEPGPLAVKARSPNHWTAREFPENLDLTTQLIILVSQRQEKCIL